MGYDLFHSENELIRGAESTLKKESASDGISPEEFKALLKEYKKLFKQTRQLVRLNDRNEKDLRQAKTKAEAATKAKADFLAAMSHEIRTPMNGVVGMIDLLRETSLDADQKHMMQTVRDSAFALLHIINDILDSSKIEAGKLTLDAVPVSLGNIIDGVAQTLSPAANDKSVRLETFIDPALPKWIMADPVRIRQILFNLGGNAVKFTENTPDNPGKVTFHAGKVENWGDDQDALSISIVDTGIGLSKEAVEGLFKPFTQAESSTTRRFGGTGLGLSICKSLIDLMDGVITVESEKGVGSSFTITVPLIKSKEGPQSSDGFGPAGTPGNLARTKRKAPAIEESRVLGQLILVAEDNVTNQDVIRRQLNLLGYACEIFSDGKQALEAWKSGNYAILLTDCHMPNMDGYQLSQAIREAEQDSSAHIPIIAITANALEGEGQICLEAGMDDYMTKPLEMNKLEATLAKWAGFDTPQGEATAQPAVTMETSADQVIDPKALKDIFGDDDATFKEILLDFMDPSEDIVREIMAGQQDHDSQAIGSAGHKLKSSSRAIGANELADLCEELEKAGKADDWPTIEAALAKLENAIAKVANYIKAL
jgi:signal transduction histidine kinase/CheY-like chemotaxis protein